MKREFEIFEWGSSIAEEWDRFVFQNKRGSIHQCSSWKNFQESVPGRDVVLGYGVKEKGQILATVMCVRMQTGVSVPFGGALYWFYSSRGPVYEDSEAAKYLVSEVSRILKKKRGMFWRIDPYTKSEEIEKITKKGKSPTQTYQPTDSLVLNIGESEEVLFSQMKRQGRRGIKAALKNNVKIDFYTGESVTKERVKIFCDLNSDTTSRNKFSGHNADYYENFLQKLTPYAFLAFASVEGEAIAAAILTIHGKKAIYYFGASSSQREHRDIRAPYLLQWEMILKSQQEGALSYDFTGIVPENEPEHAYKGITEFKLKFGGERHTYGPGKEIVFSFVWYWLYRLVKKLK